MMPTVNETAKVEYACVDLFLLRVDAALVRARETRPPLRSLTEALGLLRAALEEYWQVVRLKPHKRPAGALIKLAALARRTVEDLLGVSAPISCLEVLLRAVRGQSAPSATELTSSHAAAEHLLCLFEELTGLVRQHGSCMRLNASPPAHHLAQSILCDLAALCAIIASTLYHATSDQWHLFMDSPETADAH